MKSPQFGVYRCAFDAHGGESTGLPPQLWYGAAIEQAIKSGAVATKFQIDDCKIAADQELSLINCGRPYYKVWPGMLAAMTRISLGIDESYLHAPFKAFQIRLPKSDNALAFEHGNPVVAILVCISEDASHIVPVSPVDQSPVEDIAKFISVHYQFLDGRSTRMDGGIKRGESLEDNLRRFGGIEGTASYKTSIEFRSNVFRVAVATSLFAIENHELVMPDISREVITIKAKNKRQLVSENMRIERELAKCNGWKVGSEIDLPRPLIKRDGYSSTGGVRELEHGHIRSGHMRMQPCGEGGNDRKLIFVAPTILRPDLPIRTSRGYRIKDKVLT